jgi:hypothetical protein
VTDAAVKPTEVRLPPGCRRIRAEAVKERTLLCRLSDCCRRCESSGVDRRLSALLSTRYARGLRRDCCV